MWARSSRSRSRRRSSHVPQALLSRMNSAKWFLILSIAAILAWGCAHSSEEDSIAPLAPASGRVDPGLGPGAQALSSGPGYKSSPRWSPEGDRIAFTVDGYVVDKPTGSEGLRRWTTRDFFAEDTEWESNDALMILGAAPSAGAQEISSSLYRAQLGEDSLELENVENDVSAIGTGGDRLYFVLGSGAHESWLAMTRGGGKIDRRYSKPIEGRVAYLSLAPDGEQAVLAVRPPGDGEVSMLRAFDLWKGPARSSARHSGRSRASTSWPASRVRPWTATVQRRSTTSTACRKRVAHPSSRPAWEKTSWPRASASLPTAEGWPSSGGSTRSRRPTCTC